MIERTTDADRLNALVNDPSIRPHVGGDPEQPLDLTAAVNNHDNYWMLGNHGGFGFVWTAPRTYEVHTFILPEGRGHAAYALAMEARAFMASEGATHLWTRVPVDAENVRRFTLAAGFLPAGQQTLDLGVGPVTYDLYDWRPECL